MLERTCNRKPYARKERSGARDGFNFVPDVTVGRIEFHDKALFAFFDMHRRCRVEKSKTRGAVNGLDNTA